MQAIILAGGLGTRLRSVVSDRPKPMALVEGKPFLEYVLQGLKKSGIDDIIFAVGYKGGMVEEYFGDGARFGIRARYAYEEELLGTAGAIKNAGKYVTDEQFFVLNGDTFSLIKTVIPVCTDLRRQILQIILFGLYSGSSPFVSIVITAVFILFENISSFTA